MTRLRAAGLGALVVVAAAAAAWALAFPQNALASTLIRAVADCAAVVTLGLIAAPVFDEPRYRDALADRAASPLIVVSAVWAVAELVRLAADAALTAGDSVARLAMRTTLEFAVDTAAGRAGVVCLVAAVVCVVVTALPRTPAAGVVAAGAAAVGLAGRSLVGHLSDSSVGGIAVAVHALAAALWCGSLAALVLTVTHRGHWARVLPRFSQVSAWCVLVLVVAGVAGAVVTVDSPVDLVTEGYGRVLAAKALVTVALVALAWRNRGHWLPAARTHRADAKESRIRSRVELTVMAVAVTLAAALAVTG